MKEKNIYSQLKMFRKGNVMLSVVCVYRFTGSLHVATILYISGQSQVTWGTPSPFSIWVPTYTHSNLFYLDLTIPDPPPPRKTDGWHSTEMSSCYHFMHMLRKVFEEDYLLLNNVWLTMCDSFSIQYSLGTRKRVGFLRDIVTRKFLTWIWDRSNSSIHFSR